MSSEYEVKNCEPLQSVKAAVKSNLGQTRVSSGLDRIRLPAYSTLPELPWQMAVAAPSTVPGKQGQLGGGGGEGGEGDVKQALHLQMKPIKSTTW